MQADSEDEPSVDPEIASLLHKIHALSSKAHADLPPAMMQFQKETAIVQTGIEKLLIELMVKGMPFKVIFMSVFYFWFTLDVPLRVEDTAIFYDYLPFDEIGNIMI